MRKPARHREPQTSPPGSFKAAASPPTQRPRGTPRQPSPGGTIESPADIAEGCRALRETCRYMRRLHDHVGDPPLRRHAAGFPGLARIVVGQQLSIASAEAIWRRLEAGVTPFAPQRLAGMSEDELRALGLSRPKIRTLKAIAAAAVDGALPFDHLRHASPEDLTRTLTGVSGIGPWSADIYALFCLGHRDAFAPGDLALQEAWRMARELDARPTADELRTAAEAWRPWRGVAARLMWAWYAVARRRSGA